MFILCRLEFAFYTGINDGGHEDFVPFSSPNRIDKNGSNSSGVLEAIEVPEASCPSQSLRSSNVDGPLRSLRWAL